MCKNVARHCTAAAQSRHCTPPHSGEAWCPQQGHLGRVSVHPWHFLPGYPELRRRVALHHHGNDKHKRLSSSSERGFSSRLGSPGACVTRKARSQQFFLPFPFYHFLYLCPSETKRTAVDLYVTFTSAGELLTSNTAAQKLTAGHGMQHGKHTTRRQIRATFT